MTLVALPVRPVEPYITGRELAALMGVSVRTVERLAAEGMPSVKWGKRTRRYRASLALAWAENRGLAEHGRVGFPDLKEVPPCP